MSKFKIGDIVKIVGSSSGAAAIKLLGKKGKVISCHTILLQDHYCKLDIAPGGVFEKDLEISIEDWDE